MTSSFSYFTTEETWDHTSSTESATFAGCISTWLKASGDTVVPARYSSTYLSTTTLSGPITMWAQPIQVAFQREDLSLYTTSTIAMTTLTQAQASATSAPQPAATTTPLLPSATPTVSPVSSGEGVSTGVKAGIGMGAAAIGSFLIASALFFIWRRRRARLGDQRMVGIVEKPELPCESRRKEIPYYDYAMNRQPAELDTAVQEIGIQELNSNARCEMHGRHIVEMGSKEHLPPPTPAK